MRTSIFTLHANDGKMEVEIPDRACVNVIWHKILEHTGSIDDAGCDWYTDDNGAVYINGDWGWIITTDRGVGALVDAANILTIGRILKMKPDTATLADHIHNGLMEKFGTR